MRRREAAVGLLLASPAVVGLLAFLVLPFGLYVSPLLYRWLGLGGGLWGWRTMPSFSGTGCSCWR